MGYPQMFYIDLEIRERLSEIKNKSALVNNLLTEYFKIEKQNDEFAHLTLEEKKNLLKIYEQKDKLEQEEKKITNG
jgi:hypothetical protein